MVINHGWNLKLSVRLIRSGFRNNEVKRRNTHINILTSHWEFFLSVTKEEAFSGGAINSYISIHSSDLSIYFLIYIFMDLCDCIAITLTCCSSFHFNPVSL